MITVKIVKDGEFIKDHTGEPYDFETMHEARTRAFEIMKDNYPHCGIIATIYENDKYVGRVSLRVNH